MSYLSNIAGDPNYLGYFLTPAALMSAYPVGVPGAFATVGSTDSIWVWDEDTMAWVDSGYSPPPISFGSQYQIPFTNAGGTDFDYASGLTYDGTKLTAPIVKITSNGSASTPSLYWAGDTTTGFYKTAATIIDVTTGGTQIARMSPNGNFYLKKAEFNSDANVNWSSGTAGGAAADTGLSRLSAGKLALGNGTTGDYTGTFIAGTIGIGTTSPVAKFSVMASSDNNPVTYASFGRNTSQNILDFKYTGSTNTIASGYSPIAFATSYGTATTATEWMRIGLDGNVGIGTTSPGATYKLDVQATTPIINIQANGSGSGAAYTRYANGAGSFVVGMESSVGSTTVGGSSAWAGLLVRMNSYPLHVGTSGAIGMTFDTSNKVGIGTTSPGSKFTLIDASQSIHLNGTTIAGWSGAWFGSSSLTPSISNYNFISNGTDISFNRPSGGVMYFREANSTQMTIAAGGDVGIGTTPVSGVRTVILQPSTSTVGLRVKSASNSNLTGNPFEVVRSSDNFPMFYVTADASGQWYSQLNGGMAFGGTAWDPNHIINAAGNLNNPTAASGGASFARTLVLSANNANTLTGGSFVVATAANAFNHTGLLQGGYFEVGNQLTGTASQAYGGRFLYYHVSTTGTTTHAGGIHTSIQNLFAGGIITNAYGVRVDSGFNNGTITNMYGLKVETLNGTNKWGVYVNTDKSYFGGNVGLGIAAPTTKFEINGLSPETTFYSQLIIKPGVSNGYASVGLESTYSATTQRWFFGTGTGGGTPNNNFRIVDISAGFVDIIGITPGGATSTVMIGTTTAAASAKLQVDSTTQGFLPPRMTTTQRNAISSPAEGLHVYDLTTHSGWYHNGTDWIEY